jgi:hypothetical protein
MISHGVALSTAAPSFFTVSRANGSDGAHD